MLAIRFSNFMLTVMVVSIIAMSAIGGGANEMTYEGQKAKQSAQCTEKLLSTNPNMKNLFCDDCCNYEGLVGGHVLNEDDHNDNGNNNDYINDDDDYEDINDAIDDDDDKGRCECN